MAKYAPVGPIAVLEGLFEAQVLGNYLLLIAPDVVAHPHRYQYLMSQVRNSGQEPFIIMDNGVIENGTPLDIHATLHACDLVKADVIVLPDTLRSREATCKASMEAAKIVQGHYDTMVVPQGRTLDDIVQCVVDLHDAIKPKYWGIPRWMANDFGSRHFAIDAVTHCVSANAKIHVLGMSQRHEDDLECCHRFGVMGIDSANPLNMGMHGISQKGNFVHLSRDFAGKKYWDCDDVTPTMIDNVRAIRDYVR